MLGKALHMQWGYGKQNKRYTDAINEPFTMLSCAAKCEESQKSQDNSFFCVNWELIVQQV